MDDECNSDGDVGMDVGHAGWTDTGDGRAYLHPSAVFDLQLDTVKDKKRIPWWQLPVGSMERSLRKAAWEKQRDRIRENEHRWND